MNSLTFFDDLDGLLCAQCNKLASRIQDAIAELKREAVIWPKNSVQQVAALDHARSLSEALEKVLKELH